MWDIALPLTAEQVDSTFLINGILRD